jgi:hypothetical protein
MSDAHDEPLDYEARTPDEGPPRTRLGPTSYALIGLLVGVLGGFAVAWVLGGNPFSTTNRVEYREVVVNSVSPDADQICWADDPDRRDSPQTCAILALDPEIEVPGPGDQVVIGLVELAPTDNATFTQVVHVGPPPPREADD